MDGDAKQKDAASLTFDLPVKDQAGTDRLLQYLFIDGSIMFTKSLAIRDGKLRIPRKLVLLNGAGRALVCRTLLAI